MVRMAHGASSESARAEAFGPREVRAGYALSGNIRAQSLDLLNRHLAAAIDLHAQMKQAHWNVRGGGFIVIHQLFDKIGVEVTDYCDLLALRAEELGGTIQVAATPSFLLPYTLGIANERAHALAVAGALATFGKSVLAAIAEAVNFGDDDTAELFAEILWSVEQQLWRVQSQHCAVTAQSVYARAPPRDRVDRACDLRVAARDAGGKRPEPSERKVSSGAVHAEIKQVRALRVLLAEDDRLMAMLLTEVLEEIGHEVCAIAATAADAVSTALRCKPDLVIVDARLGEGSGIAAMETIRRIQPVPHLFISGDISRVRAMRPDAVMLEKPFHAADLTHAVQRALAADHAPPVSERLG